MYLGIDIGTSSVKAIIVDDAQKIIDESSAPLSVSRPQHLWSEQDPEHWWAATNIAVRDLDPLKRSGIEAIGLSGQMHGATCLDEKDSILRPAILWNDGRSASNCTQMMGSMPSLTKITGNIAMPGFTAPKLHWLRDNEPEVFSKTSKVLLPKDYIRLRMSGKYASDMSDSAGTLWMDVSDRKWSDDVLALTGLTQSHMPELFEGSEATAVLLPQIANEWGMKCVPIAGGGGDNAAGAIGSGVIAAGTGFLSLGTSGVIFLADNQYRPNTEGAVHTFCHSLPKLWHQMSVILSAASAVDFVAKITGFTNPADLYAAAEKANQPSTSAFFLPYLSGERTPHNNPNAKGGFFGLTHEDTPATLAQAALEGVAFALADGLDALRESGGTVEKLSVIGGGAKSSYWGKIIASAFNLPLDYRHGAATGPAYGAARLARLSLSRDSVEDVCVAPPLQETIGPDPMLRDLYTERRKTFNSLYQNTKMLN